MSNANGMQIKNAVKTAGAVAKYERRNLTFTHIELAVKGRQEFEVHVKGGGAVEDSRMFT
jgi:hypothetical protein